ncbi:MAG: hpt domain protein [Massilia sp.]|nr:hpt domain protein [Massilia sp.]
MPDQAAVGADILDTAGATSRVLGDGALYLRMLRRFQHDHPAGPSPIRDAIASADLNLAHRLAHTLKGTAGMIGAELLYSRACALELRLRTGGAHAAAPELALVEQALRDVLTVVERLLEGEPAGGRATAAAPPHPASTAAGAALLLRQLAALLDTGDGAAIDLLEQAGPTLKAALGPTGFSEVMLAANAFDFEAALTALRRAAPGSEFEEDRQH